MTGRGLTWLHGLLAVFLHCTEQCKTFPVTWGKAMAFAGYSGFPHLQLASHNSSGDDNSYSKLPVANVGLGDFF